jgi:uncharacterized membrane protein YhaH (DUF805 family)
MLDLFFSPSGRIGCAPWWYATLFNMFVAVISIFALLSGVFDGHTPSLLVSLFLALIVCWSVICVNVKRYHDLGKSGLWCLLILVPVLGMIWTIVECGLIGGQLSDNEYGPGPAINLDEDLAGLPEAPIREEKVVARNFTPLPVAAPASRISVSSVKASFGKRG